MIQLYFRLRENVVVMYYKKILLEIRAMITTHRINNFLFHFHCVLYTLTFYKPTTVYYYSLVKCYFYLGRLWSYSARKMINVHYFVCRYDALSGASLDFRSRRWVLMRERERESWLTQLFHNNKLCCDCLSVVDFGRKKKETYVQEDFSGHVPFWHGREL